MSYVRSVVQETKLCDGALVRRYQMEVPQQARDIDPRFNEGLIEVEAWLSAGAARYYIDIPCTLINTIWLNQMRNPDCEGPPWCPPFGECKIKQENGDCLSPAHDILFYPESPSVRLKMHIPFWKPPAPIVLSVTTGFDRLARECGLVIGVIMEFVEREKSRGNRLSANGLRDLILGRCGISRHATQSETTELLRKMRGDVRDILTHD